ncbi:MAG: hypothetical protein Q8K30_04370 [Candidatus Gracilibacteria bacterium]|nr:hypothetical protein [Candidatus Gracilibacteria bacterium]
MISLFKKKKTFGSLFVYNFKLLVLSISVIMVWRGTWNLLDYYFLPEYFLTSNILTIAVGVSIMFLLEYDLETLGVGDEE